MFAAPGWAALDAYLDLGAMQARRTYPRR